MLRKYGQPLFSIYATAFNAGKKNYISENASQSLSLDSFTYLIINSYNYRATYLESLFIIFINISFCLFNDRYFKIISIRNIDNLLKNIVLLFLNKLRLLLVMYLKTLHYIRKLSIILYLCRQKSWFTIDAGANFFRSFYILPI